MPAATEPESHAVLVWRHFVPRGLNGEASENRGKLCQSAIWTALGRMVEYCECQLPFMLEPIHSPHAILVLVLWFFGRAHFRPHSGW